MTAIADCGLDRVELRKLRRMLDVTRASMLFARAVVLVEGITEALLLPVLARRLKWRPKLGGRQRCRGAHGGR